MCTNDRFFLVNQVIHRFLERYPIFSALAFGRFSQWPIWILQFWRWKTRSVWWDSYQSHGSHGWYGLERPSWNLFDCLTELHGLIIPQRMISLPEKKTVRPWKSPMNILVNTIKMNQFSMVPINGPVCHLSHTTTKRCWAQQDPIYSVSLGQWLILNFWTSRLYKFRIAKWSS